MAKLLTDDISSDDRRRVVNAGLRRGRDVHIADTRTAAEIGAEKATSSFIAIRGERLALARVRSFNRGFARDEFVAETLGIVEIDTDNRIAAIVLFDLDDIDAAFEELETRYLAGEAAAHAHTWSVFVKSYSAVNRHEMPPTTSDWVTIDHRCGIAFPPGDPGPQMRASWDLTPDIRYRIEAVHRLNNLGAVVTHLSKGTSQKGFDAEWHVIDLLMVEGDLLTRCEMFDEADIDAALARFDELTRSA